MLPHPFARTDLACLSQVLGLLFLVEAAGCAARAPTFPGPLAAVGRERAPDIPFTEPPTPSDRTARPGERTDDIVLAAQYFLDHRPSGRDDCSGYVCAVFSRAGFPLDGSTKMLWDRADRAGAIHHRRVPRIGDLAFFDNTYDRDGDGKANDDLTHVAVVIAVGDDGTIVLAHGGTSAGRTTILMNLRHPTVYTDDQGRILNGYMRAQQSGDPPGLGHLAGELWRGFATVDEADLEIWMGV